MTPSKRLQGYKNEMRENVPPSSPPQSLATQGLEDMSSSPSMGAVTSKMYPDVPVFVPSFVPPEISVEALSFGGHYLAVLRQDGKPDETVDGADGRPLRFDSAHAAISAGKAKLVPAAAALQAEAKTFRADRHRSADEERRHVFANFRGRP